MLSPVRPFESLEARCLLAADLTVSLDLPDGRDTLSRSIESEVVVTIENSGDERVRGRAGVSIFASADAILDPQNDVLLGSGAFSGVRAGETTTDDVEIRVPASMTEGEYTIYAIVDLDGRVAESDESNNESAGVTVQVESAAADLAASITRITLDDSIVEGTRARGIVKIDLVNLGDNVFVPGQKLNNRVFLRPVGAENSESDIAISRDKQESLARLSNGRPKNVTFAVDVPVDTGPGEYVIVVRLDSRGEIAERNETNNEVFGTGTIVITGAFVDLAIAGSSSLQFSTSRTTIRGAYTLNNLGNVSARGGTTVDFVLVDGEGAETLLNPTISRRITLAAGRTSSQVRTTFALPAGLADGTYAVSARLTSVSGFSDTFAENNAANVGSVVIG